MKAGNETKAALAILAAAGILAGLVPAPAEAFVARLPLRQAQRWSAEPHRDTGLHDGIQVGVQPRIAKRLGFRRGERDLVEDAIAGAFAAWESPVLSFDVRHRAAVVPGTQPGSGFEIDLFALRDGDPLLAGGEAFGAFPFSLDYVPDRLLTNGQRIDGWVITGADLFLNADAFRDRAHALGLSPEERAAALQRVLAHAIGHALGLNHPDELADRNLAALAPVDLCDVERVVRLSEDSDPDAVMASDPLANGVGDPALQPDDLDGRNVLYPAPPAGETCGVYIVRDRPAPGIVLLESGGATPLDEVSRFGRPVGGLLVDPRGRLLVGTEQGLIRVSENGLEESLLSAEILARLGTVWSFTLGPQGDLFVASVLEDLVLRVSTTGEVVEVIGPAGDGVNPLDAPGRPTLDRFGNLYVTSGENDSVFRVSRLGPVERVVDASAPLEAPGALATDSAGNLYVAGFLSNNLLKRTPAGEVRELLDFEGLGDGVPFARPRGIVVDAQDRAYVMSNRGIVYRIHPDERIEVFRDPGPAFGSPGLPFSPVGPAIDGLGNVYILERTRDLAIRYPAAGGVEALFDYEPLLAERPAFFGLAADPMGSLYVSWQRKARVPFHYEIFRVDAPCRDTLDTVPTIDHVLPRRPRPGGLALLFGDGFDPEGRPFLDRRPLLRRVFSPGFLLARLPRDLGPDAELQIVNPATCRSGPRSLRLRRE